MKVGVLSQTRSKEEVENNFKSKNRSSKWRKITNPSNFYCWNHLANSWESWVTSTF